MTDDRRTQMRCKIHLKVDSAVKLQYSQTHKKRRNSLDIVGEVKLENVHVHSFEWWNSKSPMRIFFKEFRKKFMNRWRRNSTLIKLVIHLLQFPHISWNGIRFSFQEEICKWRYDRKFTKKKTVQILEAHKTVSGCWIIS